MKNKKTLIATMLSIVLTSGCLGISGIFVPGIGTNDFLSVKLYRNGEQIYPPILSVVGSAEGVTEMSLISTIKNTGNITLFCSIIETSPSQFIKPTTEVLVPIGGSNVIESPLIGTAQFEGTTPIFWAKAKCDYTYADEIKTLYLEGNTKVKIDADPVAGATMELVSSVGTGEGGATPDPTPDPEPVCLVAGTTCSINSDCCSNSCIGTDVSVAYVECNYAPTCTLSGVCPSTAGCSLNSFNPSTYVWTKIGDVPYGAFSYTYLNSNIIANVWYHSGSCS